MTPRKPLIAGNWKMNGLQGDGIALADVDGGLIGGASLNADDFWAIARAADT